MTVPDHATASSDLFNLGQFLENAADIGMLDGEEADRVGDRLYALEALVADADALVSTLEWVPLKPEGLVALSGYRTKRKDLP